MNRTINDNNSTSFLTPENRKGYTYIILALFCALSVCFNSLLVYCFVTNRNRAWAKKAKQLFYLILSDLLVSIFMIPRTIFIQLPLPRKTYEICAALNFTVQTTQMISYYHVLSLCIHRYLMNRKVHLPSYVGRYRYGIESLVIWATVTVACVPPYVIWGQYGKVLIGCSFMYLFGPSGRPAVVYLLVLLCVPWILTNAIYVAMTLKMLSTGRVQPVASTHRESNIISQQDTANQQVATASASQAHPSGLQGSYNLSQQNTANRPVATLQHPKTSPQVRRDLTTSINKTQPSNQSPPLRQRTTSPANQKDVTASETHQHSEPTSCYHFGNPRPAFRSTEILQPQSTGHSENQPVDTTSATQEQPSRPPTSYNLSQRDTANQPIAAISIFASERNKRIVKSIGLLLIAFNISILPLILFPTLMLHGTEDQLPVEIQALVFLNNISNPVIYTFTFKHLRDEVTRVLRRGLSRLQNIFLCENNN